ncbi:MAG: acetyl-CoA carboxylase carboxyltransferase subunit alpha [Armatimonadota bacterium]|nr:acetyl-CoA carboxylase carboxyltransferase subunit alpha [Armatimonadota bacterium]MDR7436176.1 acetyl-CoA carboxylase carboxyltransferase subunit alpha [Armatimonadota bacterium]MDR7472055.1 acetyl-CoA carboxylase carboxyltransferase subunit alpha [Armatimonadota bacterium]MDR7507150.1 acetyl-CoA carboxylase carboxyltransferase subunit alpha [Armatimonadota bacterium]MDR7509751.1 acetyl-CoA carboxylase carboxyltransferase subunit alpha [Armatimonadota bacterium]
MRVRRQPTAGPPEQAVTCPQCASAVSAQALRDALYVCPACQAHLHMPARDRIASLADPRSFREFDRGLVSVDPLRFTDRRAYRDRLAEARRATGLREAAVVGEARLLGQRVVLVVFDFGFLGGTMGSVVGEKVADAFEYATRARLPVVSVVCSGGARMQEGMLSLMQMAKTAAARAAHDRAGLAHIAVLTDPTFGGVAASFASLGDVLIAEPGAQIGFVGPRVIDLTLGEPQPPDSHRAETLLRAGLLDMVVPRPALRPTLGYLVARLTRPPALRRRPAPADVIRRRPRPAEPPWQAVQLARHPERPTALSYIERLCDRFVELHGDRQSGDDPAVVCGVGEMGGRTVVIVAHERGRSPEEQAARRRGMPFPEGYRKALRVMMLAGKFGLPVLTLIDTPGAYPGYQAEQRGIAQALAANLQAMASLPAPIVSVVIGEGGSGGALALGVADRVLMQEHAIYSVISPEGAAAILFRDASRVQQVAEALKITADDLLRLGIIDGIVAEPPGGAHTDPDGAARMLGQAVAAALDELSDLRPQALVRRRYRRYRHIGEVGVYWRQVVREEMQELLDSLEQRLRPRG